MRGSPDQFLRLAALGLGALAALFGAAELVSTATAERPSESAMRENSLHAELATCRTMTPEDLDTDTVCRAAWAEQRHRFLGFPADKPEEQ